MREGKELLHEPFWHDSRKKIPSLDGIRGVSIAIVFLAHAGLDGIVPGSFGLTIFFFLSGYLITTLLALEAERYGSISLTSFYARRALRLMPPLVVTLVMAIALFYMNVISGEVNFGAIASQLFFFSNYYIVYGPTNTIIDGTGPLWSLAVEEHFYLIFPLIYILYFKNVIKVSHFVAFIIAVLVWRCVRVMALGADEWVIYFSTDTRVDAILYGCLLAVLEARGLRLPTGRMMWLILALAGLLLATTFLPLAAGLRSTLRYSVQGLALMPMFHYAVHHHTHSVFRPLNFAAIRWLGIYSYSIYLGHHIIIVALERMSWPLLSILPVSAVLSVAYAAIIYEAVEKPVRRLSWPRARHRLVSSRPEKLTNV